MTQGPKINKDYKFKDDKPRVPVHERDQELQDYDNMLQRRRLGRPRGDDEDDDECRFQPQFVSKSRSKGRSVDDLLRWGEDKRFKLANQRLNKLDGEDHSFKPSIDKNSKMLAGKRNGTVEDRLIEAGKNKAAKREKEQELYQKQMFRPRINLNSKKILNDMNDELYKKDNGNTENLDFYEAVPVPTWNSSLNLGKSKKKRNAKEQAEFDARSRYTGNDLQDSKQEEKDAKDFRDKITEKKAKRKRAREERRVSEQYKREGVISPEKRREAMDDRTAQYINDYVSPYNKSMLASGLPLKSIIKKTNMKNKVTKKKNKKGRSKSRRGKSRNKNRSLSKSRGKSRSNSNLRRGRGRTMSRSQSQSARKFGRGNSKRSKRSNSRRNLGARTASNRKGNLASGHRSNSQSERGVLPFCDKFDPKEHSRKKRQRSIKQKKWNEQVRKRNEENQYNKVKSLIYSDIYDDKRQTSRSQARKGGRKTSKKKEKGHYHPLNKNSQAYARRQIGNEYMYQSLERTKNEDEYADEVQGQMKNIFNNLMLR